MMMMPGTNTYGTNTYMYSFRRYSVRTPHPPRPPPRGRSCTSCWPTQSPRNSRATSPPRRSERSLHVFSLDIITMLLVLMVIQKSRKITTSYSRWQVTKKVLWKRGYFSKSTQAEYDHRHHWNSVHLLWSNIRDCKALRRFSIHQAVRPNIHLVVNM